MIIPSARRAVPGLLAVVGAIGGAGAAWHYADLGLTLSHYDARGHLVVARRIFDSLTPGWQQIGAVWLPLPHLLNALPVQIDPFYRTGASAIAISIASFAIATAAIGWIVLLITESASAALAGAAVFALNPNVLYLQATPMTEPLLITLTTVAVGLLIAGSRGAGWAFALACLTRYEAWPVTGAAMAAAVWTQRRSGQTWRVAIAEVRAVALYPAVAIVAFSIFSRAVVGKWFVGTDFFVPENKALGDPILAAREIGWGARELSGPGLLAIGAAGAAAAAVVGLAVRERARALMALSLMSTAAIPWAAFFKGHPFRIRYMIPLIAVQAVGAGVLAGIARWRPVRMAAVIAVVAVTAYELEPLDAKAPMVVEAQWDRPNVPVRARVTACLGSPEGGATIMASMGSLGHYMQEASRSGFTIRHFLHEGNGDLWLAALDNPRPFVEWILIEEKAQGGDMLARRSREHPTFLEGYSRVCEGAGLALYKRAKG
ncbi:MAG: hypothetical protein HY048_01730 [Acidobacteria bacterium]|nr:hypothetical protein [Acidobacteriota bacterium]